MHILPLPVPDETIFRHFSLGDVSTPFASLSRSRCVSAFASTLHRANLLECTVIPDKMMIFLECRHLASPGHPGEHLAKKKNRPFVALRPLTSVYVPLSVCKKSMTIARLAAVSRLFWQRYFFFSTLPHRCVNLSFVASRFHREGWRINFNSK